MAEQAPFTDAVLACLTYGIDLPSDQRARLYDLVAKVLKEDKDGTSLGTSRAQIEQLQAKLHTLLPTEHNRIALVAGGATRIKGYVFEAPKLPEIRGASALLDWVNNIGLRTLWREQVGAVLGNQQLAEQCVVYASGGGFLAFAPHSMGEQLANAIEQCYTHYTLTANSVAVARCFSLLELHYGRLCFDAHHRLTYWQDTFERDWAEPELQGQLASYYYGSNADAPADRFLHRKTFGELVTLLSTMTSRRRDERATHGAARNVPFYQMLPWAAQCDSSGMRPAVWSGPVGEEQRQLSRASGFKRAAGQFVKNQRGFDKLAEEISWDRPPGLEERAWDKHWLSYLERNRELPYAQASSGSVRPRPAQDVHEIGAASRGYIGVIYADGNNVGQRVATAATPGAYHKLSRDLDTASHYAVFGALAQHLRPTRISNARGETEVIHPFEILAIGGDDLFIIVPGDRAFDIAFTAGQLFEQRLKESEQDSGACSTAQLRGRYAGATSLTNTPYTPAIGLSAGVVIAQETAPIFFLRELVEELLKNAKGLAKEQARQKFFGGAVDFMVLKSITMVTDKIKDFREQALGDRGKKSVRRLTARPYSWHEFAGLLATVRALKQARVPRSQLHRLRRTLDAPGSAITASVMEYLYTRTRLSSSYATALQTTIEQHWCWHTPVEQRAGGLPPWMPLGDRGWETIWPDLLELYDLVPEEEMPQ